MNESTMTIIYFALAILLIITAIFQFRYYKFKKSFIKNSKLFLEHKKLNETYEPLFYTFTKELKFEHLCKSLKQYRNNSNRVSIIDYMCGIIRENEDKWNNLYQKANKNKVIFAEYKEKYDKLKAKFLGKSYEEIKKETFWISEKKYLEFEEDIYFQNCLKPQTSILVIVTLRYTSPGRKKNYAEEYRIENESIDEIFIKISDKRYSEKSVNYQRFLMTTGKRYDILKRDNYKCQICGKSQAEGAKLEVDHIIPVSIGGKTVDENLQTLCKDCNRGKKDKQ